MAKDSTYHEESSKVLENVSDAVEKSWEELLKILKEFEDLLSGDTKYVDTFGLVKKLTETAMDIDVKVVAMDIKSIQKQVPYKKGDLDTLNEIRGFFDEKVVPAIPKIKAGLSDCDEKLNKIIAKLEKRVEDARKAIDELQEHFRPYTGGD